MVRDLESVDELVREIESDRKSMPVLLRHYLKLDARLLGFNVDPDFGDVLDGLMLVDLARVPRAILERFMGKEGAEGFLVEADLDDLASCIRVRLRPAIWKKGVAKGPRPLFS